MSKHCLWDTQPVGGTHSRVVTQQPLVDKNQTQNATRTTPIHEFHAKM